MTNSQGGIYLFHHLSEQKNVICLLIIAAVLLLLGLGSPSIYILDEARNAQAAREMMENGNAIVPTFNGELRSHKPPLHYYFMWGAYKVFGTTAFAARFFSAIMGWLTIFIIWYFVKRFVNSFVAYWTIAILICSTHFLFEFRLAVPDPYLIFFTTAGLFSFYAYIKENRWHWLILSAISLALATLAKGPVALALPGLAALCWLLAEQQWKKIFSWKWILYAVIVSAIALPWYIIIHNETNGAFTRGFFIEHNFNRFGEAMEGHGGLFLMVPIFVLLGLLPFTVFSGEAIKKWNIYKQASFIKFSISIVIVFLVFYSISGTKLPNYPMPCYPFFAAILGYWLQSTFYMIKKSSYYPFIILLLINLLLLIGGFIALSLDSSVEKTKFWALVLIVPVITTGLCSYYHKQDLYLSLKILIGGYILFNALFLAGAYPAVYRQNPVLKTLHLLNRNETIYSYKIYNPAFNFYLKKTVKILETIEDVRKEIAANRNIRIITRENLLDELKQLPLTVLAKERDLFENPVTVILKIN